jgi:hypothetical protein
VRIISIRPKPADPDFVLVLLEGHAEFPIRRAKLRVFKRFRNVANYRLGVLLDDMTQDQWAQILNAAGGAS